MPKYNSTGSSVNIVEVNNGTIIVDGRSLAVKTEQSPDNSPRPVRDVDLPTFINSPAYDRVQLHGQTFRFGHIQADIISRLHKASQTDDPWVPERELLKEAKSGSEDLRRAFKNHDRSALFETDALGRVRLRL